jgi:hypothetical protein
VPFDQWSIGYRFFWKHMSHPMVWITKTLGVGKKASREGERLRSKAYFLSDSHPFWTLQHENFDFKKGISTFILVNFFLFLFFSFLVILIFTVPWWDVLKNISWWSLIGQWSFFGDKLLNKLLQYKVTATVWWPVYLPTMLNILPWSFLLTKLAWWKENLLSELS